MAALKHFEILVDIRVSNFGAKMGISTLKSRNLKILC